MIASRPICSHYVFPFVKRGLAFVYLRQTKPENRAALSGWKILMRIRLSVSGILQNSLPVDMVSLIR